MAKIDHSFHNLIGTILAKGFRYEDSNRKGTYRIQIPSYEFVWNFKDGFPAITTKRLWWKGVVGELLFFLQGDMDIRKLWENKIHIWDKDWFNFVGHKHFDSINDAISSKESLTYNVFSLGRVYGAQWRNWEAGTTSEYDERDKCSYDTRHYVDQFQKLIETLKVNPMSTSNIVTAWNPAEKENMALPPCHWSFEILSRPLSGLERANYAVNNAMLHRNELMFPSEYGEQTLKEQLDEANVPSHGFTLKWHQRSVDTFLGLPFNIASYALLAQVIGKMTNMIPDGIIGDLSNVHIYEPHMDAVKLQLDNDVFKFSECELSISSEFAYECDKFNKGEYFDFNRLLERTVIKDFTLIDYESYEPIKAEMIAYDKK